MPKDTTAAEDYIYIPQELSDRITVSFNDTASINLRATDGWPNHRWEIIKLPPELIMERVERRGNLSANFCIRAKEKGTFDLNFKFNSPFHGSADTKTVKLTVH